MQILFDQDLLRQKVKILDFDQIQEFMLFPQSIQEMEKLGLQLK